MNMHPLQWTQLQSAWKTQRISQAMLFVGSSHCRLSEFVVPVIQLFICKTGHEEPCLTCSDCQMILRHEHPDVVWIKPEKIGGAIKIEQIRELHNSAFLTPQRSKYRLIVIEASDRMNNASANALLKILEEPAQHTLFILLAHQLSTVLPTVLSRCQIIRFSLANESLADLASLRALYSHEPEKAGVIEQSESILDGLIALLQQKNHPCTLASQWTQYDLRAFLWFLYVLYAQLQNMYFQDTVSQDFASNQINKLHSLLNPMLIFTQIDKINTLLRKLSHNINVNQTLVLEDLLFSLLPYH